MALPKRKPLRIPGHDYGGPSAYFVTVCTRNMTCRFGNVHESAMNPNAAGTMIAEEWSSTLERFAGVLGDAFIVMPNHVHGIVAVGTDPEVDTGMPTLSRVIQAFKSLSTVAYGRMVRAGIVAPYDGQLWQRGFHDHIIRNDRSLDEIREYIAANPSRWWERQHRP